MAVAEGHWPQARTAILDWLVRDLSSQPFFDNLLVDLCTRLHAEGVPIARSMLIVRTNHPEWMGARMIWRPGLAQAEMRTVDYDALLQDAYLQSPLKAVHDGVDVLRRPLASTDPTEDDFALLTDLRRDGMTDYAIFALLFTRGERHAISFASDRPGGFSPDDMRVLTDILPVVTLLIESRMRNRLARTFLETYVGPHASREILAGATRRGSGSTVEAVIVICDLRGFTSISELWPRDDVIAMLNEYFDAVSEPVDRHGGEILKFMGDGLLAIFPLSRPEAPAEALQAVLEARVAMTALNHHREQRGLQRLGYGVGVHVGDVMYGNIGSRKRLDFTVIGPAVNVASRLESLTKSVGHSILLSGAFVAAAGLDDEVEPLGARDLPGVARPTDVFALKDEPGA
ncbi:adenylate/guanylate cyclase domain-containing protein [Lichenihabitans sp. Uapishka_5]|uniref:adenylate/guanylate cyclase domain-containing protein n=1 Tax=Lichenihabitans sp. Uapishka_5 TaxID=3037302 RepID=UPI0029E7FC59|nr:adenylate/guanylate cyclase domain-containing protein [Lichenihabitans sp. Uapishka_5]MDX7950179.1 adenylate/guanylate cyclase domain-containing protein [Lichenihabitans sp. Uapishka_5]